MGGTESRSVSIENPKQQEHVITITATVGDRINDFALQEGDSYAITPAEYCQKKVDEAERLYHRSNELMENQFTSTVNRVNSMLGCQWKSQLSEDFIHAREQLVDCYTKYPQEPLKCFDDAQKFQKMFFQKT